MACKKSRVQIPLSPHYITQQALIAQWIEQRPPKSEIQVRFLVRAQINTGSSPKANQPKAGTSGRSINHITSHTMILHYIIVKFLMFIIVGFSS